MSWSLIVTESVPLEAAAVAEASGDDVVLLTQQMLDPIVDEAVRRWTESGLLDAAQLLALESIEFEITNLAGTTLGLTTAETIVIDTDAAGYGWYVDVTPSDDLEFSTTTDDGTQLAAPDSEAAGRMDLLTAVMHELGHVLGFEHGDSTIMAASLTTGVRSVDLNDDGAEGPLNGRVAALWVADRQVETDNTDAGGADVRPAAMVVGERRADQRFISAAYKWRPTLHDFRHTLSHTEPVMHSIDSVVRLPGTTAPIHEAAVASWLEKLRMHTLTEL